MTDQHVFQVGSDGDVSAGTDSRLYSNCGLDRNQYQTISVPEASLIQQPVA